MKKKHFKTSAPMANGDADGTDRTINLRNNTVRPSVKVKIIMSEAKA